MPTYSYVCRSCGYAFDIRQSFTDEALVTCPNCGQDQLRKAFGSVGVTFKGSGFYRTDSRSNSAGGKDSSSGSSSGSSSASSSSSSSD